jgi:1-acyl-sn-glycerol-3-phosphate acyltransferase
LTLRAVLALPLIAAYTVALGIPAILFGLLRRSEAVRAVTVLWGRAVLWTLGIGVTISGVDHCPAGPAVYAANHASVIDIPILYAHLPVDFRIVHKRSLYLVPVMGLYLYATGHIGIHRGSAFRAHKRLQRAAARVRDAGHNLVVFPEGTRSRAGEVGPFKRGLFALALEAGVPVVPLSLIGVKRVARGGLDVHAGTVRLVVHAPIPTAGRDAEQAGALADEVRRIVTSGCEAA